MLVITIIILLLLAGIAITSLTGEHGLIKISKDAKKNTIEAQNQEEQILSEYEDYLDEELYGEGKTTLARKVKVGDYVKYTPDTVTITDTKYTSLISELGTCSGNLDNTSSTLTQEPLNWRVLDIQNGEVRLISENSTTSKIELIGVNGYNNGVYLIDKTCSTLYNNSTYAKKVQNLKIEDIKKYLTWDYKTSSEYGSICKYGEFTATPYTTNTNYPLIYAQEKNNGVGGTKQEGTLGMSEQTTPITGTSGTTSSLGITKTSLSKPNMDSSYFTSQTYHDLFINYGKKELKGYFCSSRCVRPETDEAYFGISIVIEGENGGLATAMLYRSQDLEAMGNYAFRPVVTLKANTLIDITDTTKDGSSAANAYELVKQD